MDRRQKVELFEQIRREYEFGVGTIQGVARKLHVHRRLVRQAIASALPPDRRYTPRAMPKIDPVKDWIEQILVADQQAPRKQRHTARRLWQRLRDTHPDCPVAESTVRQYVRERKRALGLLARETFVPQSYAFGQEAQVDWFEATVEIAGERLTAHLLAIRSMASGAAYHCAFPRATQQAFLEAHERAFAYFGGVFHTLRYDNLKAAVQKILRGHRREESARFIAFRSHWRFAARFCTPGQGHEKGGVEGEGGYFRRNHLVPVPAVASWDELHAHLRAACRADEQRVIAGRAAPIGVLRAQEQPHLLPLAAEAFDLAEVSFPQVDASGCVRVKTNAYSVPRRAGTRVLVKLYAATVDIWHEGQRVAQHQRCYRVRQQVLELEHYLDVLERKPGALVGSTPLAQWRAAGRWPASYDAFWQQLQERQGRSAGTRAMIELLQLGRAEGGDRLAGAVAAALRLGCVDVAAVRHLLAAASLQKGVAPRLEVGALARYERPLPTVTAYDQLLSPAASEGRL